MSGWQLSPTTQQPITTGVFLNHSNGHVNTRIVSRDSQLLQGNNTAIPVHTYATQNHHYNNAQNITRGVSRENADYEYGHQMMNGNPISNGYLPTQYTNTGQVYQNGVEDYHSYDARLPRLPPLPNAYDNDVHGSTSPTWNSSIGAFTNGNSTGFNVFDAIARYQLHPQGSTKGRRCSSMYRRGSNGLVGKLSALNNPVSKTKLKEEQLSIGLSEYTSSYGGIVSQIREVNRESKTECEFLEKSLKILRSTAVMTILLVMVLLLPFGMVVLGVKYLHACPKEPFLPIYLLVGGCFAMLKMFTVLWRQMRERKNSDSFNSLDIENQSDFITDRSTMFTDMVLSLFLLAWFCFGNYLTWKIYMPNFTRQLHSPADWCEESLYMFCVAQIIASFVIFTLFMWVLGCLCCARHVCCFADKRTTTR